MRNLKVLVGRSRVIVFQMIRVKVVDIAKPHRVRAERKREARFWLEEEKMEEVLVFNIWNIPLLV